MDKPSTLAQAPLRLLGKEPDLNFTPGGFGAVLARAGVGKTAVLVQIALSGLLEGKKVLHVSLSEPVRKVCLWYEEVFSNITGRFQLPDATEKWEAILPSRFIMTFSSEGFTVPRLSGRVTELMDQGIFIPDFMLVDGLNFDGDVLQVLADLRVDQTTLGGHLVGHQVERPRRPEDEVVGAEGAHAGLAAERAPVGGGDGEATGGLQAGRRTAGEGDVAEGREARGVGRVERRDRRSLLISRRP